MKLYLVRHGDAVAKEVDPDRPLSEEGRQDVKRVAEFLGEARVRVPVIFHSGRRRAEQTARLFAAHVSQGAFLEKTVGMDPLDSVSAFAPRVAGWTVDTMVVGHLPFMGRLVSLLVVGDETAPVASFKPGAVVCLHRGEEEGWSLAWMIDPELLMGGREAEG